MEIMRYKQILGPCAPTSCKPLYFTFLSQTYLKSIKELFILVFCTVIANNHDAIYKSQIQIVCKILFCLFPSTRIHNEGHLPPYYPYTLFAGNSFCLDEEVEEKKRHNMCLLKGLSRIRDKGMFFFSPNSATFVHVRNCRSLKFN